MRPRKRKPGYIARRRQRRALSKVAAGLQVAIEKEIEATLNNHAPVLYDARGVYLLSQAVERVWGAFTPVQQQTHCDKANTFWGMYENR